MNNTQFVAFLRGINVGGVLVKMVDLKEVFASLGFQNIRTLLASGNVIFEANNTEQDKLVSVIEQGLEKQFGRHIDVLVRKMTEIQRLVNSDPFKGIPVTPATRLNVTFFTEPSTSSLKIPYESPGKNLRIVSVAEGAIASVVTLIEGRGTVDLMGFLEKQFGKKITTRGWNTIGKIAKAAS